MSPADPGSTAASDGGSPADEERRRVVLDTVPALRRSLAVGAARSAAAAARRDRTVGALPEVSLAADGLLADADRLTDYQHLVGLATTDRLPAGFVHVLAFPVAMALMVRPDFPLPLLGMVHTSNAVTQYRPVQLAEPIDVVVHAERLAGHRRGVTVDLVGEALVDGVVVWRGVSTYLAKGWRLGPGTVDDVDDHDAPAPASWDAPTPTGLWRLPADVGRRYAAISGDHNPIHTSTPAAKALGFPRTIAHGMYTAARALAQIGEPEAFTWTARFSAPVLVPSTVSVRVGREATDGSGARAPGADDLGTRTLDAWSTRTLDAWSTRHHLHVEVAPA